MKRIVIISLLLLSELSFAAPTMTQISFNCPTVTGNAILVLTKIGNRIAGYGMETINNESSINLPYFTYFIPSGANIPAKLATGSYFNSGTDFDSTTGAVSCSFTSSTTFSPFTVQYHLTNAHGTYIANQTNNSITLNQFVG